MEKIYKRNVKINVSATEFSCFDEALRTLNIGDSVLIRLDENIYVTKVFKLTEHDILCRNDTYLMKVKRTDNWTNDLIVRIDD